MNSCIFQWLEVPYKPRDKCVAWGAIASAAGALGSAAMGLASQSGANDTNLQMVRETNKYNAAINERQIAGQKELAEYQNQWNLEQWNRENAYNDPSQQIARIRAAGVNPYLQSGISAGEASSLQGSTPSQPSVIPMDAGHVEPLDYSLVTQGVNSFMQNQLLQANIDKTAADAKISEANARTQSIKNAHELFKIANDASRSEYERDLARRQLRVAQATEANEIFHSSLLNKQVENESLLLEQKVAGQKIQNAIAGIDSQYRARMNAAQLRSYYANIQQCYAAARSHDAAAAASYAAAAVSDVTAAGIRIDNKTKESLNNTILDKAYQEADESYWNAQIAKKTYTGGHLGRTFGSNSWDTPASDRSTRGRDPRKSPQGGVR